MVPAFVESLPEAEAGEATKLAFEFLILTAARTSEVLGPAGRRSTAPSKRGPFPRNASKPAASTVSRCRRGALSCSTRAEAIADGGPYVFPGRPSKSLSNMVFLMLLRWLKRHDITAHGFRSAFRDWAAERTSFARAVCEGALAHVVRNRTEAAYFRSDLLDLRRQLMESWARFVTSVQAKVVSISA